MEYVVCSSEELDYNYMCEQPRFTKNSVECEERVSFYEISDYNMKELMLE